MLNLTLTSLPSPCIIPCTMGSATKRSPNLEENKVVRETCLRLRAVLPLRSGRNLRSSGPQAAPEVTVTGYSYSTAGNVTRISTARNVVETQLEFSTESTPALECVWDGNARRGSRHVARQLPSCHPPPEGLTLERTK